MQCFSRLAVSSLLTCSAMAVYGGSFSSDFNSGTPAGTTLYGTTVVEAGVLKITKAVGGQSGSIIFEDLDSGNAIYGFDMRFKARVGGGTATPADGFSVNFAPDLPDGPLSEEGAGSGLRIAFDLYDNGGGEAPSIDVKLGDTVLATHKMTIPDILTTGTNFDDVHIELKPTGLLNLSYKSSVIYTNFVVQGYQGIAGRFGIGGRTGGSTANQWIDDLQITTFLNPQSAISQQPLPITALAGSDAQFSVQVTNPDGVTYQWFRNGTAISGATSSSLLVTNVTSAMAGTKYKVQITGPNNTVTSDEVTLAVADIPAPTAPKISLDFNDAAVPSGTIISGTSTVEASGGLNDSGVLKLTTAENSLAGGLIIDDVDAGAPVYGFTAQFDALVGGGTVPPADGFSFSFTPTATDPLAGNLEEGLGTGVAVSFDLYDSGGGEAPAIDIEYNGKVIATKKVPLSFLETGNTYGKVLIRLEADGTMDVAYRGVLVHSNVSVAGFTSITGGKFVLAGRTGGLNENQWVDNVQISTVLTPGELRISSNPVNQTVLIGRPVTFTAEVNIPAGTTFQWLKNGTPIAGATSNSFTIAATTLLDTGAKYQLRATRGGQTVTSAEATVNVVDLTAPATPTLSLNFDNAQLPAGTTNFGNAFIDTTGGVNDSGVLKLTVNENSQSGAFVISPLLSGAEIGSLTAAFDLRLGGGTPNAADGTSFNFAPDLPNGTLGGAEEGAGAGLTVTFDIYDNGGGEAPSVDLKWKGAVVGQVKMTKAEIETGDAFRKVLIKLSQDGKVDLAYGDRVLFTGLQITNYTPIANGKFGFYARTGGENENQWVDNIQIAVAKTTAPLRITTQPVDLSAISGNTATFSVAVSDPVGTTYQWFKNGVAIAGATSATFVTPATTPADTGAKYKVVATGPGGTATSSEVTLTVVDPLTISNPNVSFDFENGAPDNATLIGGAAVDSGVLKLTEAATGLQGGFFIPDANAGQPVSGFTAAFRVHVGGGTVPPADGFSFVWGNDFQSSVAFGEDGTGSGLIVSFDIYDNGGGEAPAIDILYGGDVVASRKLPISAIETGAGFADVIIRLQPDGTLDLQYNGQVIYNNLQLPGFAPVANGNFAFGARTGGLTEEHYIDDIRISTSTGSAPPQMSIAKSANGGLTVSWTGAGTLQAADSLAPGAWAPVTGATSPYPAPNDRKMRFFRVLAQ